MHIEQRHQTDGAGEMVDVVSKTIESALWATSVFAVRLSVTVRRRKYSLNTYKRRKRDWRHTCFWFILNPSTFDCSNHPSLPPLLPSLTAVFVIAQWSRSTLCLRVVSDGLD